MNWSDERYVRVYTRDTSDWVSLGWEAQALLLLLLRKVDRAGVFDMGRRGIEGLADLLRMPIDVVKRALSILIDDGCVTLGHNRSQLVVTNFIEAQEARQSDRQRQHETRARRRDRARLQETGHTESRPVTPYLAVPSLSGSGGEQSSLDGSGAGSSTPVDAAVSRVVDAIAACGPEPLRQPPRHQERAAYSMPGSVPAGPLVCSRCQQPATALVQDGRERLCGPCRTPTETASPEELRAMVGAAAAAVAGFVPPSSRNGQRGGSK